MYSTQHSALAWHMLIPQFILIPNFTLIVMHVQVYESLLGLISASPVQRPSRDLILHALIGGAQTNPGWWPRHAAL